MGKEQGILEASQMMNIIACRDPPPSTNPFYYFADRLGTSRVIVQAAQTSACYHADFLPFGGEVGSAESCFLRLCGLKSDSCAGIGGQ